MEFVNLIVDGTWIQVYNSDLFERFTVLLEHFLVKGLNFLFSLFDVKTGIWCSLSELTDKVSEKKDSLPSS